MFTFAIHIGVCIAALFTGAAYIQWAGDHKVMKTRSGLLEYATEAAEEENRKLLERERLRKEEEERQKNRVFKLDFLITHGAAFGGCSAVCQDGTFRRGSVLLEKIMMYGRQPSGREYTYYIEEEGIRICAMDEPDKLMIVSDEIPFAIRESGMGRGEGQVVNRAVIHKDILYYLILESRHELSIRASRYC